MTVISAWYEIQESKRTESDVSPALRAVSNKAIIASGAFVWASLRLFPAMVLLSKFFTGPIIFASFADANRQLFTGTSVFPSLQLNVSIRNPFLRCISVWSYTFDPSSVFLQLVRLTRLSSTMNTLFLLSSVKSLRSLFTISAARRDVKRSQFVFSEFRIRYKVFFE